MATLQLFQHPENVKISILPFTLSQAEMLYFRKYLTNSQKSFFGWKMMKVAIVSENFKGSGILFCNGNVTNFSNIQKM